MENILSGDKRTLKDIAPFLICGFIAFLFALAVMRSFLFISIALMALYFLVLLFMGAKGLNIGYLILVFSLPLVLFVPMGMIPVNHTYLLFNIRFLFYLGILLLWGVLVLRKKIRLDPINDNIVHVLLFFYLMEIVSLMYFRGINIPDFRDSFVFQDIRDQSMSLIMFLLTISLCKNKESIKKTILALSASAPIVIGIGFLEWAFNCAICSPRTILLREFTQVSSTFWDPNHLSRYLVILILLYLPFYLYSAAKNTWLFFLSLSSLILLPLTRSVSGFISLVLGFLLILFNIKYYIKREKGSYAGAGKVTPGVFVWFILIIVIALMGAWILSQVSIYSELIFHKMSAIEGSARQNMDLAALEMFLKHPLFGVGFSNYSILFSSFNPGLHLWGMGGMPIIHDSFMSVASELGITGLILLFIIYIYFGKTALINSRNIQDDFLRRTQISLGAIWIALIVNSFAYFKFFEDPKVWLVAGLIYAINKMTFAGKQENAQ
jgi:hypothetical protein